MSAVATHAANRSYRDVLRNRHVAGLLLGDLLANVGTGVIIVAMSRFSELVVMPRSTSGAYRRAAGDAGDAVMRGETGVLTDQESRSTAHGAAASVTAMESTMAERKPAMKDTQKSARSTTASGKASEGWTDEERAAMKERGQELKTAARRGPRAAKADGERDVLTKIAEMPEPDRVMAERIHAVIRASAPALTSRLWYGMPAYAKEGKVVCFFQSADKFNSRYATFGFNDTANLDDGAMWPTSFALTELTAADEARIGALVKKAVS